MILRTLYFLAACFLSGTPLKAQQQSLLWEISGNGLTRPSYLFGTMHVSHKLAFNLNDSFYHAIRRVETVCLEVDPETWQERMADMGKRKARLNAYGAMEGNDFLRESTYHLQDYNLPLKAELKRLPQSVNLLLYRSQKRQEDFEEDTFLDMYIYQLGKRMNKKSGGLEDYERSEKMMYEALGAIENDRISLSQPDEETGRDNLTEKLENAYRRGDLAQLDSLDRLSMRSKSFREIFIDRRNEIQGRALDSFLKRTSVFAGIGAAHLAGEKGVINYLRNKGYTLRPVKVTGQPGRQKLVTENSIVPVAWSRQYSHDGLFSAEMPGPWYQNPDESFFTDIWQYADMANGVYYSLARIVANPSYRHVTAEEVRKKADSLLFENIPGKILEKKFLEEKPFPGIEVLSRNRRGDLQRLRIYVTPFEIIVLKVSGPEFYMKTTETDRFFQSIRFHPVFYKGSLEPHYGGFRADMPGYRLFRYNRFAVPPRLEFHSYDTTTGNAYLLFRSDLHQFNVLGEDTVDLRLMEASFFDPDMPGKILRRDWVQVQGYPALSVVEKIADSSLRETRFIVKGSHGYVWSVRHALHDSPVVWRTDSSLSFVPYRYDAFAEYTDTSLHFKVQASGQEPIDQELRLLTEKVSGMSLNLIRSASSVPYWPPARKAVIGKDSTGEKALIQWQSFPDYFHIRDTARFWEKEINSKTINGDLFLARKPERFWRNQQPGVWVELRDTGCSRSVHHLILLSGKGLLTLSFVGDTVSPPEPLVSKLAETICTPEHGDWKERLANRLPDFFRDLLSADSAASEKAFLAMREVYFGPEGVPLINDALNKLNPGDRNYYDMKSHLIAELGLVGDGGQGEAVRVLEKIYQRVTDTVIFQQEVVQALTRQRTSESYRLLQRILVEDPPVFDNEFEYRTFFSGFYDSLKLSASLFPGIMPLYSNEGMKPAMLPLLAMLADSGMVDKKDYAQYYDAILFDARVELKKLKARDEKAMAEEVKKSSEKQPRRVYDDDDDENALILYARLLMPFYKEKAAVRDIFEKILATKNEAVQIRMISLMAARDYPLPDSLLNKLASRERSRASLWRTLSSVGKTGRFPLKYRSQELMARSELLAESEYDKMDSVQYLEKRPVNISGKQGWIYIFKYRLQASGPWKLGFSGMQPYDTLRVSADGSMVTLTDKRIPDGDAAEKLIGSEFSKMLLSVYPSGRLFYEPLMPYQFMNAGWYTGDD